MCKWDSRFDSGLTAGAELDMTTDEIAEINTSIGTTGNRLANFLKSMALKLGLIADYIVEQGTSGIWTYEKWNSGKAVCWGTIRGATGTFTSHGIGVYYSKAISTSLPNKLFSTVSYAIPTMISGGGGLLLPRASGVSVSVVLVDFIRFYGGSDSLNIQYAVEVKGKWK